MKFNGFLMIAFVAFGSSFSWAKGYCSGKTVKSPKFTQVKQEREQLLKKLANHRAIATGADQTLSKLLKAQSPVIMSWLNKRNLVGQDEIKIVLAWRQYYLDNFILGNFKKTQDPKVRHLVYKTINKFYDDHFSKAKQRHFQKQFIESQKLAIKKVSSYNMEKEVKAEILNRIKSIKLFFPSDIKNSRYKNAPLDILSWGVAYDPQHNQINMGVDALGYPNDLTIKSVFLHEIGHSFDPCRWGAYFSKKTPFGKVNQCLRGHQIKAKKRDDSKMAAMVKAGRLPKQLMLALKLNPHCNKRVYPPVGTQADQLPEAFADWFSAEALGIMVKLDHQLRVDLCAENKPVVGSSYLENSVRLEKIYFANPNIKQKLKIKNKNHYCEFK